jgi:hypothetical protein
MAENKYSHLIGIKKGPATRVIDADHVSAFCKSVGVNPSDEVPPTYLTVMRHLEFELLDDSGILLSSILHGDQEYTYNKPIKPGMTVEYESVLDQVNQKRNLQFFYFNTKFTDKESGELLATSRTNVLVRGEL